MFHFSTLALSVSNLLQMLPSQGQDYMPTLSFVFVPPSLIFGATLPQFFQLFLLQRFLSPSNNDQQKVTRWKLEHLMTWIETKLQIKGKKIHELKKSSPNGSLE